jgi:hypothetical protein
LGGNIDYLIDGVNKTEGGVEAATRDGTSCVDHSEKGERNSSSLQDSILALLGTVVNLANDALAEEECTPKLEKENLAKTIKEDTTCLLIIGAKEGRLSHTEMSVHNTEEATNDLSDYN